MATKAKSAKGSQAKNNDNLQAAEWAKQVGEHLVEAQKKWIEITTEQNALVLKAVKEGMELYNTAPTPALGEWARQGVESFVEAQKRWAEMVSQQSAQLFGALREGASFNGTEVMTSMSDYMGQGLEAFIQARTQWLDFAA